MYRGGTARTAAFAALGMALFLAVCVALGVIISHEHRIEALRARTEIPGFTASPGNRAAHYFEAARVLYRLPRNEQGSDDPAIEMIDRLAESGFRWEEAPLPLREFVDLNGPALEILHSSMAVSGCDMPIVFTAYESGESAFDAFDKFRALGRLLLCASAASLSEGHQEEGVEYAFLALTLGQDIMSTGSYEQVMTGYYLCRMGSRALAAAVAGYPLSDAALSLLDEGLRNRGFPPVTMHEIGRNDTDWMALYMAEYAPNHVAALRVLHMDRLVGLGYSPSRMGGICESNPMPAHVLLINAAAEEWVSLDALKYTNADLVLVSAGVAIQRFVRDNARLPDTLDALVPEYLDAVPADPANGGPLQCTALGDTITVSTGKERHHNGRELTFSVERVIPTHQDSAP